MKCAALAGLFWYVQRISNRVFKFVRSQHIIKKDEKGQKLWGWSTGASGPPGGCAAQEGLHQFVPTSRLPAVLPLPQRSCCPPSYRHVVPHQTVHAGNPCGSHSHPLSSSSCMTLGVTIPPPLPPVWHGGVTLDKDHPSFSPIAHCFQRL